MLFGCWVKGRHCLDVCSVHHIPCKRASSGTCAAAACICLCYSIDRSLSVTVLLAPVEDLGLALRELVVARGGPGNHPSHELSGFLGQYCPVWSSCRQKNALGN